MRVWIYLTFSFLMLVFCSLSLAVSDSFNWLKTRLSLKSFILKTRLLILKALRPETFLFYSYSDIIFWRNLLLILSVYMFFWIVNDYIYWSVLSLIFVEFFLISFSYRPLVRNSLIYLWRNIFLRALSRRSVARMLNIYLWSDLWCKFFPILNWSSFIFIYYN